MITKTELEKKGDQSPDRIIEFKKNTKTLYFTTANGVTLELTIVRDSVLRFRYLTEPKNIRDFSYGISKYASSGYGNLEIEEEDDKYIVTTEKVICHIEKANLCTSLYDALDNTLILKDEIGFHWEENYTHGGNIVKMSKKSHDGEAYYGLGDKPSQLNLKGKRFQNWATDSYAYGKETDPIYKAIPFYTGLHHGKAYGIFFDNTFRSFFDFSHERKNVTSFWAQGGVMDYYFFYGPSMMNVVEKYTDLTGKPLQLPPLWALGYHQCKWSYYPESKVKDITAKFRKLQIPCDAIYLDIDYMDNFKCFTWNKEYFPNPKQMVKELSEEGFKTVVIIDPGIKVEKGYDIFEEGLAKDYFCKRADGPYMQGKVWPGECYFPDFTNPEVREWWAGLFKELIEEIGVKGVWNDMNEPAVMEVPNKTFPDDVRHNYDGEPCSHRKAHNIYGMQMARATFQGLKKFGHPKRPFLITRAAYSGTQKYTSTWTGDNIATWEHLWIANVQAQRMALSGFSFVGSDIGGFAQQPDGELFARWIQLGIFHPFCRTHSSGDHGEQEPWMFGDEITGIVKKFIELRYQLLPYLYTSFWRYLNNGTPILSSLVLHDQEDIQTHHRTDEFIFGDQILVCPILEANSKGRRMYMPRGNWFHYWDNELFEGGKELWVDAELDSLPMFVKEGAIIPKFPIQQYVGEKEIKEMTLEVYFKMGKEDSFLYEDDQDGYNYTKGMFNYRNFRLKGKESQLIIRQHNSGKFNTSYDTFRIKLIGLPFIVSKIEIDKVEMSFEDLKFENHTLVVPKDFAEIFLKG